MGLVYTEIILKNAIDVGNAVHGNLEEKQIRQKTVKALVDTGAGTLIINESFEQELGLEIRGEKRISLANNAK